MNQMDKGVRDSCTVHVGGGVIPVHARAITEVGREATTAVDGSHRLFTFTISHHVRG